MNFIWPTDTKRVTSNFRDDRKDHHGTDIADPGHHEIFAVADGVVTRSYPSSSYGECIMILHEVDGQTYESVYAHMRAGSRSVYKGDKVKQGQSIGVMGNTGHSYGQHLHFELHKGRWNFEKSNAVNPINYLEKEGEKESPSDTYKIKAGDTFWGLEEEHGFTHGTLQRLNPGVDPKNLKIGQVIKFPSKTLYLPASAEKWRVYPTNVAPVVGNEKAFIKPKKFGGLQYEILDTPQKDVVTIKTSDFGVVNIYVAPSTGAVIK
jgi:LysM repeat protein